MNKLFKKGCNLVKYQTYNNIKNGLLISGLVFGVSNIGLTFCGVTDSYIGYVSSLLYSSYACLQFSKGERYTRDVNELRNLYNEFIRNYNKMNRDFSNNNPISIYTMFDYLLDKGYLSLGKQFKFDDTDCFDLDTLLGTDVIYGNGVCRHISSMLTDVLNDYGISSINAICYIPKYAYELIMVDKNDYSMENNINFMKKFGFPLEDREDLIESFLSLEKRDIYLGFKLVSSNPEDKIMRKKGNHLITYSLYDGKSYYLEPTNFNVYRVKDIEKGIIHDQQGRCLFIKKEQFYRMNDLSDKEIMGYIDRMNKYRDSISLLEEEEMIASTRNMCEGNMDIFEKFYNDNNELYGEIVNQLRKIKKRKK